jgi:hypothetical protein
MSCSQCCFTARYIHWALSTIQALAFKVANDALERAAVYTCGVSKTVPRTLWRTYCLLHMNEKCRQEVAETV